jgi:hypothetical protein
MQEEPVRPPGPPAGVPPPAPSGQAATPPAIDPAPVSAPAAFSDEDGEPFDAEAFFNPFCGPPEGEDAWLARVASPVADEYLACQQPPVAGAREALAAGFTHKDHEPGARGFAAGGPLDVMEPGAVLAGFADDAVDGGLDGLSDDELVGLMGAARRLASRAAGIELAAIAGLDARRAVDARAAGDWRQHEHVADEVAVALTLTCRAADRLLDLANGVTRLPAVTRALAAGQIDLPKATVYVRELAGLGDVPAAAIAAVTITGAPALTTGELGEVLRRAVLAHDPEAARRRRERAQQDARVETWAESRGTAALAGRDLPPAAVLAADAHIDGLARQLKAAGAPGTLEQLRAKVFLALLTSQPLYTLLPGNDNGWDWNKDSQGGPTDGADPDGHGGGGHLSPDGNDGVCGPGAGNPDQDGDDHPGGSQDSHGTGSPDQDGTGSRDDNRSNSPGRADRNGDYSGGNGDGGEEGPSGGTRRPGPGTGGWPAGGGPGGGGACAEPACVLSRLPESQPVGQSSRASTNILDPGGAICW